MKKSVNRLNAEKIIKAGDYTVAELGLRFDKVAISVLEELDQYSQSALGKNKSLILTMTAPIRLSGKTVEAVREKLTILRETDEIFEKRMLINGNKIAMRIVSSSKTAPRFVGFVHNPTTKPGLLFQLAQDWLKS